ISMNARAFRDTAGQLAYYECMVTDITAYERTIEALRLSEERYRYLIENANDIIFTHDLKGNVTSVNAAAQRILGYRPEALLGRAVRELVSPDYRAVVDRIATQLQAGVAPAGWEIELPT